MLGRRTGTNFLASLAWQPLLITLINGLDNGHRLLQYFLITVSFQFLLAVGNIDESCDRYLQNECVNMIYM